MKFRQHELKLLINLSKIKQIYSAHTDLILAIGFKPGSKPTTISKLAGYTHQNSRTARKKLIAHGFILRTSDNEFYLTEKGMKSYNLILNDTAQAFNTFTEQLLSSLNQGNMSKADKIIAVKKLTKSGLSQRKIARQLNMPLSTTNKYSRLPQIAI